MIQDRNDTIKKPATRVLYYVEKDGCQISKLHAARAAAMVEAYERGFVYSCGVGTFLAEGVSIKARVVEE